MRSRLLGVAVGLALADSSIVTLALPEILGQFDVGDHVGRVGADLVQPRPRGARRARRVRRSAAAARGVRRGSVVFAAASLACGLAPSFEVLVGAPLRAGGRRGAARHGRARPPRAASRKRRERLRIWVAAGVLGAALGPALGGILTQLLGWESIFLVQVPLALALLVAARGATGSPSRARAGRPSITANRALLLGGRRPRRRPLPRRSPAGRRLGMSPAAAGVVVSVMPVVAIVVGRLRPSSLGAVQGIACGVILLAGGLAALALMPRAGWGWTIPPQILVGAGLGLTVAGLTEHALRNRPDQVVHGGWTIAARHAGVVLGLVLLAPVLDECARGEPRRSHPGRCCRRPRLGDPAARQARRGAGRPRRGRPRERGRRAARRRARFRGTARRRRVAHASRRLQEQLDRAVTSAFSGPFLLAAALTLCALVPVAFMRRRRVA